MTQCERHSKHLPGVTSLKLFFWLLIFFVAFHKGKKMKLVENIAIVKMETMLSTQGNLLNWIKSLVLSFSLYNYFITSLFSSTFSPSSLYWAKFFAFLFPFCVISAISFVSFWMMNKKNTVPANYDLLIECAHENDSMNHSTLIILYGPKIR